jgi:hypothetical protein
MGSKSSPYNLQTDRKKSRRLLVQFRARDPLSAWKRRWAGFNLPGRCLHFPAWAVVSALAMVRRLIRELAWLSLLKEVAPL